MIDVLYGTYLSVLVMLAILAASRFGQIDLATRMIAVFIWLGLSTELAARIVIVHSVKPNNLPIYNVSCLIEWMLICLYFNYSILSLQKWRIGWGLGSGGILFGIGNLIFIQPITRIASNFLFFECAGILSLSFYSIYKLALVDDDNLQFQRKTHFWIPLILIFYQMGSLWSWVAFEVYLDEGYKVTILLQVLLLLNCIITYSALFFIMLLYPKMKRVNV
jgi:hypothetical protein